MEEQNHSGDQKWKESISDVPGKNQTSIENGPHLPQIVEDFSAETSPLPLVLL